MARRSRRRRLGDDAGGAGVPGDHDAALGVMVAVRVRGAVKRRTAGIAEQSGDAEPARAAPLQPQGGAAAARLHHQALRRDREGQGRHEGAAPAPGAGRHLRCARGRLFLRGADRAGGRARDRRLPARADVRSAAAGSMFWLVVVAGGIIGYVGPSLYIDRRINSRRHEHRCRLSRTSWISWWCARIPG